jgi:hypothetical protein
MARTYPRKVEAQRRRWTDPSYRERWTAGAKARWATTEHLEKMAAVGFKRVTGEAHREAKLRSGDNPTKYSRLGIPSGMNRATAEAAWAEASKQDDMAVRGLEAQGLVPATVSPDSNEALAKAALHEVALLALGQRTGARKCTH